MKERINENINEILKDDFKKHYIGELMEWDISILVSKLNNRVKRLKDIAVVVSTDVYDRCSELWLICGVLWCATMIVKHNYTDLLVVIEKKNLDNYAIGIL